MSADAKGTVEERWSEIREKIDNYYDSISLKIKPSPNIEKILNYSEEDIKLLTSEECCERAYILKQYALYLQKQLNFYSSQVAFASNKLSYLIGKHGKDYGDKYTKFEQLKLTIIANNTFAKALYDMELDASIRLKTLYDTANIVRDMAKSLESMQYLKGRTESDR